MKNIISVILPIMAISILFTLSVAAQDSDFDPTEPVTTNADWTPRQAEFNNVEMVLVPPGCFTMGSTKAQRDYLVGICTKGGERTEHPACSPDLYIDEALTAEICFDEPFYFDRTQVTRAMYAECVAAGACTETPASSLSSEDDDPINIVKWFQARDYCEWREARLPTEAEWEYAARGPDNLIFPWGNEPGIGSSANEVTAWSGAQDIGIAWKGVFREWTGTLYRVYPYSATDGREDIDNMSDVRTIRDAGQHGWNGDDRPANRDWAYPNYSHRNLGFRCARDYTESDTLTEITVPTAPPASAISPTPAPALLPDFPTNNNAIVYTQPDSSSTRLFATTTGFSPYIGGISEDGEWLYVYYFNLGELTAGWIAITQMEIDNETVTQLQIINPDSPPKLPDIAYADSASPPHLIPSPTPKATVTIVYYSLSRCQGTLWEGEIAGPPFYAGMQFYVNGTTGGWPSAEEAHSQALSGTLMIDGVPWDTYLSGQGGPDENGLYGAGIANRIRWTATPGTHTFTATWPSGHSQSCTINVE